MAGNPAAIVFDVNETLSDMSPLADRFADVGAPPLLAKVWFASLLRDGFALAAAGDKQAFAYIGAEALRGLLPAKELNRDAEEAVKHIMTGLSGLTLHPDVPGGVRALKNAGYRLATLTNGSTGTAEKLFTDGGIRDQFDLLLSVEDAPAWKPAPASYHYASGVLGVPPGQLLLVAVHPWDIHGAARAGLHTAWLNRTGAQYPAYFSKPDYTVATLEELPGALAADC